MSDINIYADQTAIDALTPITGDVVLRASDNAVLLYNGSAWKEFQPDAGPAFPNDYSLSLDGSDDYLSIPDNLTKSVWNTQDWTFSMFIKPDASEISSADTTIRRFMAGTGSNPYLAFRAGFFLYIDAGQSAQNGPSLTNDWFHVMFTNDTSAGSSSTATSLYIDGNFISNTRSWRNANGIRNIGRWYSGSNSASLVDEISIFDSVKSASDLQTAGTPNDITSLNPVLWYRCGDGDTSQTLTNNGSGSSLDGTLHNGPTFSSDVPS